MGESAEQMHPKKAFGWAARDSSGRSVLLAYNLNDFEQQCRATGEKDVAFKVMYCGICHSDLHNLKNEWGTSTYPLVPGATGEKDVAFKVMYCGICHSDLHKLKNEWGTSTYPLVPEHEILGVVTEVGSKVQKFKVGDKVGVGCMVGSCHSCDNCANNLENYYPKMVLTYGVKYYNGTTTYGGYSDNMVADEHFVVRIPDNLPLDGGAPLLCAGITVYSPLKYFGLDKPGMHVGVVGLGGLGHVAVKFAKAMGVKVTVISTSPNKKEEAIEHLGADSFSVSRNQDEMQPNIISADVEVIPIDYVNTILERLLKANVKYRFVIDIGNTLKSTSSI
ncbi:hypothetical protein JRO89_XS08G0238300 [Xanthoceras sorbifolium]|uniref:Enoyl reductase (ER) domain-containing protein n=1 Tax=Xanthoceras sorbifolium TaxID=99658 RepID=A0ABQ8HR38_9ROSI|nr:hypothetical protein JRO89_XS08G0238300 [Xanthoceras sorbifolium]